jgi:bifunctional non-homologous end joining protein LigD
MGLKEYKHKRNFKKTPEPAGRNVKAGRGRHFVVQKHDASRLHYDFRLEHDGVLKSWAVPKGPSLDPSVKSLAVQVEDHPLEYAKFEGIIPQGEYGGGTVMVWDRGTWEPEADADKGLKSGKLKFTLHGKKLHGSWSLVRMSGRAGEDGKNWLLIKHRDAAAKSATQVDILKQEPLSVLSNRDLDEIAADADATWSSKTKRSGNGKPKSSTKSKVRKVKTTRRAVKKKRNAAPLAASELAKLPYARRAAQPKEFGPQLATLTNQVPEGDGWLHELKFDGYRILAHIEGARKVRLISRNGKDWTARFRVVADAISDLPLKAGLLDGEVVALDNGGVSNFQRLQNSLKTGNDASLVYYVFDAPYLDGYDLTNVPLLQRKEVLARVVHSAHPKNDGRVRYSDHIEGHGAHVLQRACQSGMEGIIAKRAEGVYHQFRTPDWLKIKCTKQQEFVIGGYTKPEGSRIGFGALLLGYYANGELIYAGRVGTGFTQQSLKQLAAELKKRTLVESPFTNPPTGAERRGVTWVKPELVGEVEFTEWTSDGRLRHPSFCGLREDKPAKAVIRENPKVIGTSPRSHSHNGRAQKGSAIMRTTSKKSIKTASRNLLSKRSSAVAADGVSVAGVRLTHPDRVLYAEDKITKRDLAEYYERVADWILPYVAGRPLTLVRCPEGYMGECFFQKHLTGSLPDAIRGVMVDVKGKQEEYVAIDDVAGLVGLVQMGVLELHPWPAREDNLDRPDMLVFDLDPGEGTTWKDVVAGARELRERLEAAGLTTFLRTSGGKGLHVVVPLARRNSWDEFKAFAKSVADTMTRDAPERYIATMSKAKRRGKLFIDYLRNQRGATAIASYSTRRRRGAPVATPIGWDELSSRTRPDKFTIENLPKRLNKLKKDPWADFFKTRQTITRDVAAAFEP